MVPKNAGSALKKVSRMKKNEKKFQKIDVVVISLG